MAAMERPGPGPARSIRRSGGRSWLALQRAVALAVAVAVAGCGSGGSKDGQAAESPAAGHGRAATTTTANAATGSADLTLSGGYDGHATLMPSQSSGDGIGVNCTPDSQGATAKGLRVTASLLINRMPSTLEMFITGPATDGEHKLVFGASDMAIEPPTGFNYIIGSAKSGGVATIGKGGTSLTVDAMLERPPEPQLHVAGQLTCGPAPVDASPPQSPTPPPSKGTVDLTISGALEARATEVPDDGFVGCGPFSDETRYYNVNASALAKRADGSTTRVALIVAFHARGTEPGRYPLRAGITDSDNVTFSTDHGQDFGLTGDPRSTGSVTLDPGGKTMAVDLQLVGAGARVHITGRIDCEAQTTRVP